MYKRQAIEYVQTPPVKHTSNKWEKTDYEWQLRSNAVYQMRYHVYENTRYDRQAQKSVPYSWSLKMCIRDSSIQKGDKAGAAGSGGKNKDLTPAIHRGRTGDAGASKGDPQIGKSRRPLGGSAGGYSEKESLDKRAHL